MLSVYLESTIPSYLVARPNRNVIIRSRQKLTQQWWGEARPQYRLLISDPVLDEIGRGERAMADARRKLVAGLELLQVTDRVAELHEQYLSALGLPDTASIDALHSPSRRRMR